MTTAAAHAHDGERRPVAWDLDNVVLTSMEIDIGSAITHMVITELHLERLVESLSGPVRSDGPPQDR